MAKTLFLVDGPFVSDYLKQTIYDLHIPVVKTLAAIEHLDVSRVNYVDESTARLKLIEDPELKVYTNSENALDWVYSNHQNEELIRSLLLSKDKVRFRETMKSLAPEFYFKEVALSDLSSVDATTIPYPVILKPSVGFFSLGVYGVQNEEDWHGAISSIHDSLTDIQGIYPESVLDNSTFIIEELIEGAEFAVDCYFDAAGKPVIFNIMKHLFASQDDMNDRVYITSASILDEYRHDFQEYLSEIAKLFKFKRFPAHIELRVSQNGDKNIVEINPLRFGGWCSTPDLTQYAWGFNIYKYLHQELEPDWPQILSADAGIVHSLIVLNNSTGVKGEHIKAFDYNLLLSKFDKPIELRKTDYKRYPLFGFLMCEVSEKNMKSLQDILHSNLKEYISY